MRRIHRIEVNRIDYTNDKIRGEITGSYKWTRGTEIVKKIYGNDMFNGVRLKFSYEDLLGMVQECRDDGNVIYDIDYMTAIEVRHWSYRVKQ